MNRDDRTTTDPSRADTRADADGARADPAARPTRRAALAGLVAVAVPLVPAPALARRLVAREPFAIGVLSRAVLPEAAREAAMARFERALARPVRLRRFAEGARLVDAASAGRLDLTVHTALSFAAVRGLCGCTRPLLRPLAADGTAGLRAVLIVRGDGPTSLAELGGAAAPSAVLGAAPGTVAGEMARRGASADAKAPLSFAGEAPDAALSRFMAGGGLALAGHERVDAGGHALGGTLERLGGTDGTGGGFRVLWRSRPVWHGPLALSARAEPMADAVTGALLALSPGSPALAGLGLGRVGGFVAAGREDYAALAALLRT